jgi:hypothetical protein
MAAVLTLVGVLPCLLAQESAAPKAGGVAGQVRLDLEGVKLSDVLPIVVYLDGVSGRLSYPVPPEIPVVSQKDARFSPVFLVVTAGQTIALANDDRIVHNVFSYSPPKKFDLGLYPTGETRNVTLEKPGVTELFCSIHAKMNATIFVTPSPYYSQVNASGGYEIRNVPPGKYRMRTWSRKLPTTDREIEILEGKVSETLIPFQGGPH